MFPAALESRDIRAPSMARASVWRQDQGRALGARGQERVRSLFTQEKLVEGTLEAYRASLERWGRGWRGAIYPARGVL